MADKDITLFELLFDGSSEKGASVLEEGLKRSQPREWSQWSPQRRQITAAIADQVPCAFDFKLGSVFAEAWHGLAVVREAIDPARTPPGVSRSETLASHEIEWSSKPELTIAIDGVEAMRVELELMLVIGVEFARVTICDARLKAIEMGEYKIKAELLCDSVIVPIPLQREGRLPGEFAFDPGISLGHARYADVASRAPQSERGIGVTTAR